MVLALVGWVVGLLGRKVLPFLQLPPVSLICAYVQVGEAADQRIVLSELGELVLQTRLPDLVDQSSILLYMDKQVLVFRFATGSDSLLKTTKFR